MDERCECDGRFLRMDSAPDLLIAAVTAAAALASSAAAGYALVYTGQSIQATRDQLAIVEQGRLTERYGRAVEQLGSAALDVRIGGIYALERLMAPGGFRDGG